MAGSAPFHPVPVTAADSSVSPALTPAPVASGPAESQPQPYSSTLQPLRPMPGPLAAAADAQPTVQQGPGEHRAVADIAAQQPARNLPHAGLSGVQGEIQQQSSPADPSGGQPAPMEATSTAGEQQSEAETLAAMPDELDIVCGLCKGVFLLRKGRVVFQGQEMSPTDFERAAGKGSAKKWKGSVRVVPADGSPGTTIGNWLALRRVDIKNGQLVYTGNVVAAPRAVAVKPPPRAPAPRGPVHQPGPATPPPPPDILAHLKDHYIGLLPGDPTVGVLPSTMPESAISGASDLAIVDLKLLSRQALLDLAQSSCPDPFAALLPDPPGVLPERQANVTGREAEVKRPRLAADKPTPVTGAEAIAILHKHLTEQDSQEDVWEAMGLKVVRIAGKPLDLRKLWALVSDLGGYEAVCAAKKWARTAVNMGWDLRVVTNGGHLCRVHYQRILLPYELQLQAQGGYQPPRRNRRRVEALVEPTSSASTQPWDGLQPSEQAAEQDPDGITANGDSSQAGTADDPAPVTGAEAVAVLHKHLTEQDNREDVWGAMGMKPVAVAGKWLDLRKLWTVVSDLGGYEAVCAAKNWAKAAVNMGLDLFMSVDAGYKCRVHYKQILLPYELHLRSQGQRQAHLQAP